MVWFEGGSLGPSFMAHSRSEWAAIKARHLERDGYITQPSPLRRSRWGVNESCEAGWNRCWLLRSSSWPGRRSAASGFGECQRASTGTRSSNCYRDWQPSPAQCWPAVATACLAACCRGPATGLARHGRTMGYCYSFAAWPEWALEPAVLRRWDSKFCPSSVCCWRASLAASHRG